MAVAYESVGTAGWGGVNSASTITITKPTGLAVGDLMVAHIGVNDEDANTGTVTASSWTSLGTAILSDGNGMAGTVVLYKVADSGDVAASDFSFTNGSGEGMGMAGAIYRISGSSGVPVMAGATTGDSSSPTFTNTITPAVADSLLLFLYTGTDSVGSSQSVSGYAVTTDNPTWTERYDQYGDLFSFFGAGQGVSPLMSGATAPRTAVSATGDSTCSITTSYSYNTGVIVVIPPAISVTVSPAVIEATVSVQDPTVAGGATVSPAVIELTASVQAPTVTTPAPKWVNEDKSATSTFTNEPKS